MSSPENRVDQPRIAEKLSESDRLNRVKSWTLPYVEVDDLIHLADGRVAVPLVEEDWIPTLSEVSRLRADSQNEEGVQNGYYPEGYIFKRGTYIYSPSSDYKVSKRRYKPRLLSRSEEGLLELFPESDELIEFTSLVQEKGGSPLTNENSYDEEKSWALAEAWSEIGYSFFKDQLLKGRKRIEIHHNWPVIFYENPQDLKQIQPHAAYQIPENTQAVSFVATPQTLPKPGEVLENTPFIACLEGCPPEVIKQHIRTQLAFAQATDRKEITPILVSKSPDHVDLEEHLQMKIKERILALYISQKEGVPYNWHETDQAKQAISAAQQELFTQKLRKSSSKRDFYIGNRPDRLEVGPEFEEKISEWLELQMNKAFRTINIETVEPDGGVSLGSRSRELNLVRLNYFSFFPLSKWGEVAEYINRWEGRESFRKSFKIPNEILSGSKVTEGENPVSDTFPPQDLDTSTSDSKKVQNS